MALKDILENGYGIDFDSLTFKAIDGMDTCSRKEIKESMANNTIKVENSKLVVPIDNYMIDDSSETLKLHVPI